MLTSVNPALKVPNSSTYPTNFLYSSSQLSSSPKNSPIKASFYPLTFSNSAHLLFQSSMSSWIPSNSIIFCPIWFYAPSTDLMISSRSAIFIALGFANIALRSPFNFSKRVLSLSFSPQIPPNWFSEPFVSSVRDLIRSVLALSFGSVSFSLRKSAKSLFSPVTSLILFSSFWRSWANYFNFLSASNSKSSLNAFKKSLIFP